MSKRNTFAVFASIGAIYGAYVMPRADGYGAGERTTQDLFGVAERDADGLQAADVWV